MYRTNSQPPGLSRSAPPGPGQGLSCLLHDGPGSGRSSDPHPPPAASLLSLSSAIFASAPYIYSPLPSTGRPHWAVHGVSVREGFLFTYFAYCILHQSLLLVVSLCPVLHLAYTTSASRLRPCLSLVYLIHTLQTSYLPIPLVSILSSRAFSDCFVRPVSFFFFLVNPTFRHHRHFFLVLPIILFNGLSSTFWVEHQCRPPNR